MDFLEQKLKVKPVPKNKVSTEVKQNKEKIEVKTTIVDKTDTGYDRNLLKQKMRDRGLVFSVEYKKKPEYISTTPAVIKTKKPVLKLKKLRKKLKLKISNKISKGTITQFATPLQKAVVKTTRKLPQVPEEQINLVLTDLKNRIPAAQPVIKIKSNAYYLNNRQIFINFMSSLFGKYKEELAIEAQTETSCSKRSEGFSLMTHQKIVRDYLSRFAG